MKKKIIYHLKGILFGYPKRCTILDDLTFKKIQSVYPTNDNRPFALVKVWKVAVKTAMPDERFVEHKAWMLHILCEHTFAVERIASYEHAELRHSFHHYKIGPLNFKTIKSTVSK